MARRNSELPTSQTVRKFGWILAGSLAVLGHLVGPSPEALWLQMAGAAIFAIGTVRPSALMPIYAAMMWLLRPVFWLGSYVVKPGKVREPRETRTRRKQIA